MADKTFSCTVLTPERTVLNTEVTSAVIPAHDGEVGIGMPDSSACLR